MGSSLGKAFCQGPPFATPLFDTQYLTDKGYGHKTFGSPSIFVDYIHLSIKFRHRSIILLHLRWRRTCFRFGCSPGTARHLRGMALSLDGREPIQSALTLPIPAGLVLISAASGARFLSRMPARWPNPAETITIHPRGSFQFVYSLETGAAITSQFQLHPRCAKRRAVWANCASLTRPKRS